MLKTVTFKQSFKLRSVGLELPPGDYQVHVEHISVMLRGRDVGYDNERLVIPDGVLGKDKLGAMALLFKGELGTALKEDRVR